MSSLFTVLSAALVLAALLGIVFGWLAFLKTRVLQKQLGLLRGEISHLHERLSAVAPDTATPSTPTPLDAPSGVAGDPIADDFVDLTGSDPATSDPALTDPALIDPALRESTLSEPDFPDDEPSPLFEHLRHHWMIWLGGICVGLAGVFMVRYSIERGLLGPTARIVVSIVTGLGLHAGAEWLRRKNGAHPAFAALAGGASLILYAALLGALQLYQIIPPGLTFVLLATVSLLTMVLAVRHGPMLAMLGLLGGYVVPLLVSTGSGNIPVALAYTLIISAAAMLLMRWVYRPWLLAGMLIGALGWWALSLLDPPTDGWRGPYIFVLGYLLLALPFNDFWLRQVERVESSLPPLPLRRFGSTLQEMPVALIMSILVLAQSITLFVGQLASLVFISWVPFTALIFVAARRRDRMVWLPWAALLLQMLVCLLVAWDSGGLWSWPLRLDPAAQPPFLKVAAWSALLHVLLAAWNLRGNRFPAVWSSLMLLAPLLWLALGYALTDYVEQSWHWAAYTVALGLLYAAYAGVRLARNAESGFTVWLILGAHFAYALAATFMLEEAGLTLVLATQVISLAFVIHKFNLPGLGLLMKAVLAVIVLRLTLNPWLINYPVDTHWSLWLYGGSTLCCAIAAWRLRGHTELGKWLELATLHLLVLTLWSETRYWLHDGNLFDLRYDFVEAAINTNLWAALAMIYRWRARLSRHLQPVFTAASHVLLAMAAISYLLLLSVLNPLWNPHSVSATPLFNMLLLAFGLPVVMFALVARTTPQPLRTIAAGLAAVAAFVFVNMEIHHLWNGSMSLRQAIGDGELYTYSIVWLALAIVVILYGQLRGSVLCYRTGIGLLGLVIAKIFLIDMAGLEGLLRVASFMGLGLSLLGIAYLLQRFDGRITEPTANQEGIS